MMKFLLPLVGVLCFSFSVSAAQLSSFTANKVQKATQLQQEEKLGEAITLLADLTPSSNYDKAFVGRILGVYYWQAEKPEQASKVLARAVALQVLEPQDQWSTQRMLADVLFSEQRFELAARNYQALLVSNYVPSKESEKLKLQKDKNELHLRIATSFYQLQQWESVITHARHYQSATSQETIQALRLTVVAQLQLKRWFDAEQTLSALIRHEPNNITWWHQQISTQLQQNKSSRALETYALAKHQGVEFSQSDYKTLAQLYAQHKMPERAARIIQELMDEFPESKTEKLWKLQATYWQVAKEWESALSAWKNAMDKNPKHSWSLAKLQIQQGDYQAALKTMVRAEKYANPEQYGLAKIRLFYKLGRINDALATAKRLDESHPSQAAAGWVQYLQHQVKMN